MVFRKPESAWVQAFSFSAFTSKRVCPDFENISLLFVAEIFPNPKNHTEFSDYNPKKMPNFWIRIKIYLSLQSKITNYDTD